MEAAAAGLAPAIKFTADVLAKDQLGFSYLITY